jgi:putative nucleotidyltransferase with HDIG domain
MSFSEQVAEQVRQLPPMPASILALRREAANPNSNFDRLAPLLRQDPGLCADLLRLANSAFYGVRHTVDTVEEAVRYLGMANLVEFVATAFSERAVRRSFAALRNLEDYFAHSRTVARACGVLAEDTGVATHDRQMLAVAGLLHDIGRLVLVLVAREESAPLLGTRGPEMRRIVEAEKERTGTHHCDVGMQVCRKWRFPETLQDAVLRHHVPVADDGALSAAGAIVFLAHLVTAEEVPDELVLDMFPAWALERIGVTPDVLASARARCAETD